MSLFSALKSLLPRSKTPLEKFKIEIDELFALSVKLKNFNVSTKPDAGEALMICYSQRKFATDNNLKARYELFLKTEDRELLLKQLDEQYKKKYEVIISVLNTFFWK